MSKWEADASGALTFRSRVLHAIRGFFVSQDFIEVETPVRLPCPALELHIDAEPSGDSYLRTSPELFLKRLLANGHERLFEMGPVFRHGERGALHNPEYTMLEWYRAGADYMDVLADARALLEHVTREVLGGPQVSNARHDIDLCDWCIRKVRETFQALAGWDPVSSYDADRFDMDLVNRIEPALPRQQPVVLKDYPVEAAALSRIRPGAPPVAERWELYLGGVELANAYSELTDAEEQRLRFEACAEQRRELGKPVYPLDEGFLAALERGLPPCAGVALGVDRLVMVLAGADSVEAVRSFCP